VIVMNSSFESPYPRQLVGHTESKGNIQTKTLIRR
jgi:hypothetical protein